MKVDSSLFSGGTTPVTRKYPVSVSVYIDSGYAPFSTVLAHRLLKAEVTSLKLHAPFVDVQFIVSDMLEVKYKSSSRRC
jgi:hypothetical protein